MARLLRAFAAMLLPAIAVFLLVGCGGGSSNEPTPATHASTSASATRNGGASNALPESLIGQVVVPTDLSPQQFKESVSNRRPVVVDFYMTGPSDDSQVRSAITSLESRYKGQVDFYDYLYTDGQSYGDLTSLLKVNTTPAVIIINRQAKVQIAWTGYVDSKSIEQGIVEALGT